MTHTHVAAKLNAQLSRARISKWDFDEAESYLQALRAGRDPVIRRALLMAAVVAYSRPFTNNELGVEERATPKLSVSASRLFLPHEHELHERLLALRNEALAHSSYARRPVGRVSGRANGFVMSGRPFDLLSQHIDTKLFAVLCTKLAAHCEDKLFQLNRQLIRVENAA